MNENDETYAVDTLKEQQEECEDPKEIASEQLESISGGKTNSSDFFEYATQGL